MGSLKVGDKAIVVSCNPDSFKYKHKVGTIIEIDPAGFVKGSFIFPSIIEIDPAGFVKENFIFPYRIKVKSGDMFWCRAIPCSSLIEELF